MLQRHHVFFLLLVLLLLLLLMLLLLCGAGCVVRTWRFGGPTRRRLERGRVHRPGCQWRLLGVVVRITEGHERHALLLLVIGRGTELDGSRPRCAVRCLVPRP